MTRPSETLSATIATIIGAVVAILAGYGVHLPDGVEAAVIVLVGYIAAAVTWYVARKQRAGAMHSAPDGKVE